MKNRVLSILTTAVLAISAIGGLAGCGGSGSAPAGSSASGAQSSAAASSSTGAASAASGTLEVHIGDQPSFFILKVAEAKGFFEEEFKDKGVKIVVDNFVKQGSAIVEAMNAGSVDLGVIGTMPFVTADANNSHFVAISSVNLSENGFKLYAGKGKGITKVEQFKGKKVGVKFSSNEHEMLLTLLAKANLTEADVEIANLSAEDCLNSLISGDIDGSVLKGDQLNAANSSGANIVADNSQSGIIENLLVGREQFVKEHPEVVTGVLKVLEKTKQWIDKNPEETVDIFVKLTSTDKEVAKVSFESRTRSISIDEKKFTAPIQRTIDFLTSQGTIENKIKLEDIVDTSYYKNSGVSE